MARPFEFNKTVRFQARLRQEGLCACCGEDLDESVDHSHHVIPNQTGVIGDRSHNWLREVDNCVVICEMCHNVVHAGGHFRDGATAPPDYFPFSHAVEGDPRHSIWARTLTQREHALWSTKPR